MIEVLGYVYLGVLITMFLLPFVMVGAVLLANRDTLRPERARPKLRVVPGGRKEKNDAP